jgi:hypothetical protein
MFESLQAQERFLLSTNVRIGTGANLACYLKGTGVVLRG